MPQEKWFLKQKKTDFYGIAEKLSVSPYLVRIMCNRGMETEAQMRRFLYGTPKDMHDPGLLPDITNGMKSLLEDIKAQKHIRIIGDYDVDGVTSTYILATGLELLQARVSSVIPHRIQDGYGLNANLIRAAREDGAGVILTCDNGISAFDEIELANSLGMDVYVTDHHEVPFEETDGKITQRLVNAKAVINPKRLDSQYPFKEICGAVVAYKCIQVLFNLAIQEGLATETDTQHCLKQLLSFAALGTACDVMPLLDENRIIVKYGLLEMEKTENIGLKKLIQVTGLDGKRLTNYHLGFVLGPCINATGRLDSAHRGLELFQTTNEREAVNLAVDLQQMNEQRKEMTQRGEEAAIQYVEENLKDDKVLVVYLKDYHESIAGIIAGRIRERYAKPCLVLTDGAKELKGSGRSIEAYHMRDALWQVEDLLTKYGGHKLAAGFSLPKENLEKFRESLNNNCKLTQEDFVKRVDIDIDLPLRCVDKEFTDSLALLEPTGTMNPSPLFAQAGMQAVGVRIMGKNSNVAKFTAVDKEGTRMSGVYFGDVYEFARAVENGTFEGRIAYTPSVNVYKEVETLQIIVQSYQ